MTGTERKYVNRYGKRPSSVLRAGAIGAGLAVLSKAAENMGKRFRGKSSRIDTASNATTNQNDSMLLYRRKRAPKKVRRKARKKFNDHIKSALKTRHDNCNLIAQAGVGSNATNAQNILSVTSGYLNEKGCSDDIGSWRSNFGTGQLDPQDTSIDFFITGISTEYTIKVETNDAFVDVYEFVFRKDMVTDGGDAINSVAAYLAEVTADEEKLQYATNKTTYADIGWTPFDANDALKNILIKSKQRFHITAGSNISFNKDTKYRRPYKISGYQLADSIENATAGFHALAGVTRGIFIVWRGVPDATYTSATASTVRYVATTKYRWKYLDSALNASASGY